MVTDLETIREGSILLVDKPRNWTSFDVVNKLRYTFKVKKIGHAGTLDPLATGLLLLGTGKCTKQLHLLQGLEKVYSGIIEIGKTTPSYDLETDFDSEVSIEHIDLGQVKTVVSSFIGSIEQLPPKFSAIKVDGVRAYKKARRNEEVKIEPRTVEISRFDFQFSKPEIHFKLTCSKGTYIRSIAHDLGKALGVGAYLKSLRREQIGEYKIENASSLEELIAISKS